MKKTLTIRTQAGRKIACLKWHDGTIVVECDTHLSMDVTYWIRRGLDEWIGVGENAVPRSTASTAPEFLARLGAYVQRHFGFATLLEEDPD